MALIGTDQNRGGTKDRLDSARGVVAGIRPAPPGAGYIVGQRACARSEGKSRASRNPALPRAGHDTIAPFLSIGSAWIREHPRDPWSPELPWASHEECKRTFARESLLLR